MNAVYFYNCKFFGLRAGDEHRDLCVEQYTFASDGIGEYIVFNGRSSKTYHGGLGHRKLKPKELKIYSIAELGERDMVQCFKLYLSLIPSTGPFYRRPCRQSGKSIKFSSQVVGRNTLGSLMQRICKEANFSGTFTGHSGKVTCATELFRHGVDEQLIQLQTGHRSDAVRAYKCPANTHFHQVSKSLQPPLQKCAKPSAENTVTTEKTEDTNRQSPVVVGRSPLAAIQVPAVPQLPTGSFSAPHGNITLNFLADS